MLKSAVRGLASLRLAVVLIVVLAAVLAGATFVESAHGREYAHWYVYGSAWFIALLTLLAVNILAATLVRFPWQKRQLGFVVTHAGLLVLLVGSIQTFVGGIEGQVSLREGEQTDTLVVSDRSRITVERPTAQGRVRTEFAFRPGPVDWPEGRVLDFGSAGGLGLKVLKFYRHAREHVAWVADEVDYQGPALKLLLSGPTGNAVAEDWLAGTLFGGEAVIGPTHYELLPVPVASLVEDFTRPPTEGLGARGILSLHYAGRRISVKVDEHLGKRIPVGDDGLTVEIVEYLPDARPTPDGRFFSRSDKPGNPLLELKIHDPREQEATRQIAFAKRPLLTLDGVHGRLCPVRFWYHHGGVAPLPGAAFLQTPEGRLYCRAVVGGAATAAREVKKGDRLALGSQFSITVTEHLPRARQEARFVPSESAAGSAAGAEAAALLEVTAGDLRREVWLQRNDRQYGFQSLFTKDGVIEVAFGFETLPLGYTIQLKDFTRRWNPGRRGSASFASTVRLQDAARGLDEQRQVALNAPLVHGKYTLYQSSFQEPPGGREISVLSVASDPGRQLKYLGSLMICAGAFIMFFMRTSLFKKFPSLRIWRSAASDTTSVLAGPHAVFPHPAPANANPKSLVP